VLAVYEQDIISRTTVRAVDTHCTARYLDELSLDSCGVQPDCSWLQLAEELAGSDRSPV
jgi:hypothetical protein